jgi:hypothetical protein
MALMMHSTTSTWLQQAQTMAQQQCYLNVIIGVEIAHY